MTYYPPVMQQPAFTCPHCNVYAGMSWSRISRIDVHSFGDPIFWGGSCAHCEKFSYWFAAADDDLHGTMFYPRSSPVPMPHQDMPENIASDYMEARSVLPYSVKSAAALLRLSLQKLCIHLGKSGNINSAIGELVADGMPRHVQMAFDSIRIIGNESVHPGVIRDEDLDVGVAQAFELMNFIVQDRITRFQQAQQLYESLPEQKRLAVDKRDGSSRTEAE